MTFQNVKLKSLAFRVSILWDFKVLKKKTQKKHENEPSKKNAQFNGF